MTTEDTDNGWDALAEDLGIQAPPPAEKPKPPAAERTAHRSTSSRRDPRPEIEQEADDFGSGVSEDPRAEALYDPGPETVVDHAADIEETTDPLDEGLEGDESAPHDEESADDGGKRRRRRRRRRKKGTGPDAAADEDVSAAETDEESTVEEGEAPAPLEGDDEDAVAPSAVDEEMAAEVTQARPEWHVMSWQELVSRLYRPG